MENSLKSVNQITFFILNGRCGNDKGIGKCTLRGTTLIDYAISSTAGLSYIKNFEVEDTDILFSDGHSLLSIYLTLPCQQKQTENTHIGSKAGPRLWDESNTETFLNNIDVGNIHIIEEALDTMRTTTNAIATEDLNSIVVQISNLFTNAAQKSFKTSRAYLQKSNLDKPWFGTECKNARDAYHKAKSSHQKSPSVMNKQELQNKSRKYKRTMNKHIRKHKFQTKQKLRKLNKHKPKEFWKIINNLEKKLKMQHYR